MRCPFCQFPESRVIDSRTWGDSIRRRRECESCHRRFSTLESVELKTPAVVKKDGRREPFDRLKVLTGLRLACRKRPIPEVRLEEAVDTLERVLQETGEREIPAVEIGARVLDTLRGLDPVAYLRFASVYYALEDAEAFLDLVRAVQARETP